MFPPKFSLQIDVKYVLPVFPTELIDGTLFDSFGISCRFFISKDSSVLTAFLRRSQKLNQKAAFSKNVHMSAVAGAV